MLITPDGEQICDRLSLFSWLGMLSPGQPIILDRNKAPYDNHPYHHKCAHFSESLADRATTSNVHYAEPIEADTTRSCAFCGRPIAEPTPEVA